jgi:hypothetical protein
MVEVGMVGKEGFMGERRSGDGGRGARRNWAKLPVKHFEFPVESTARPSRDPQARLPLELPLIKWKR